jgi:sarcosine oxidase, subunit beta
MLTRIVIVGGGILGCSIAYHLARAGARDVLLIERDEMGAAPTSCSAGLVGQVRPSPQQTALVQETFRAIRELERELGEPVGFRPVGSLRVVATAGRERDMHAQLAIARAAGVEAELIGKEQAQRLVPGLEARGARAIAWVPADGYVDPYQLTMAYARAARARGATIWTGTAVTAIEVRGRRVTGVDTARGRLDAGAVVVAAGAWAGPVAGMAGVALPVAPVRSHFWITAPHPMVAPEQPVVRFPDLRTTYTRPEVGGLLIGCYEPESRAYDAWALPPGFSMREVEREWDVFLHHVTGLRPWFPFVEDAEMVGAMAGLTTYPPDGQWVLGRVPEVEGLVVATGCSGLGVTGSGGIGAALAELVLEGRTGLPLEPFRVDRFGPVDPRSAAFQRSCAAARSGSRGILSAPPDGERAV